MVFDLDAGLQGYNLFLYCANDPIGRIDITGADSEKHDDLDQADDEVQERGGGGNGFHSGGGWSSLRSTLRSAANGLGMATGTHQGFQRHHILSDKNQTYTPQYKEVTDRYYAELDQSWNTVYLNNHRGRHTNAYHEFMLAMLYEVDSIAQGDPRLFREGFGVIKDFLQGNDWVPYAKYS